jgi:hypothetical protein
MMIMWIWGKIRAADCEAITEELGLVDWHGLFSRKGVDLPFYDVIWSCFEKFVPGTSTQGLMTSVYCLRSIECIVGFGH